jgi:hypothetical protein
MFDTKADQFFANPRNKPSIPGDNGVLYLLRRDILLCLGQDPCSGGTTCHKAVWPGAMAILAGIDLVAKFYKGDDGPQSGPRFKDFVGKYFLPISPAEAETIYQLRNALLHSFGLYSKKDTQEYRFLLTAGGWRRALCPGAETWQLPTRQLPD